MPILTNSILVAIRIKWPILDIMADHCLWTTLLCKVIMARIIMIRILLRKRVAMGGIIMRLACMPSMVQMGLE